MGHFNPDGSWTSNKGKRYGPNDVFTDEADSQENAADNAAGLTPNALADPNGPQGNVITGSRVGSNAPGAELATGQADVQRQQLSGLLEQLQQQAATGSGSWEGALRAATQHSQATAQALGQSDANASYGSALDNIGNAQAAATQRGVGQGDILREQSKLSAQEGIADLTNSMGAQDIGQANAQAGARQGVRETNILLKQNATKNMGNYVSGIGQGAGAATSLSDGGRVPGHAVFGGDDPRNDVIAALLSPDEIVVPRTAANDPDKAAEFARAVAQQHGARKLADGGSPYQAERTAAWEPGKPDPTGPKAGTFDLFGVNGDVQAPSIENGGILDAAQFGQTRDARNSLEMLFGQGARGAGPSVAPQMITNANDAAIQQAHGGGANAVKGAAVAAQGGGGEAAVQKGREQAAAQRGAAAVGTQGRGQELSLAQAQQQAAWANTMSNLGIDIANQAALRNMFSGAGQAATAFSGAGGSGGYKGTDDMSKWDSGEISDVNGGRGGPSDLSASDPEFKAFGGVIGGYSDGGRVEGHYPSMPKPQSRGHVEVKMGDVELHPTPQHDSAAEYEEETGDKPPVKHAKAPAREPSAYDRAAAFAQSLGAALPHFAEGGGVPDAGAGYQSFDPYSFPERRDPGPVVYVSTEPTPGSVPVPASGGAGGGAPDLPSGAGGAGGGSGVMPQDRGSGGATGGPSDNQIPQHEAIQPRAAPPASLELPPGVVPKGGGQPDPEQSTAPAPKPVGSGGAGVPLPPSHQLEEGFAANEAQLAAQAETDAAVAHARAEEAGLAERSKAQADAQIAMREAHARARQQTNEAMTRWQSAQDEFNRIDTNVDPGRFWASRTTGQKVLGIIGLALGAAGTGPDGINRAASMMNQAIDRDLEAQKAEHELKLKKGAQRLQGAQTYYAMAREAGHDDIAATELAKSAALDAAALKADQLVAATNEPLAKAKGAALSAALRGAAIDKQKAAEQRTFENRVQNQTLNIHAAAAANKGAGLGEGERKEFHDVTAAAANALDLIKSIRGGLDRTSSPIPGKTALNQNVGTDAARLGTDATALTIQLKDIAKLGQIGPADKALLEQLVADPQAVFTLEGTKRAKLDQLENIVRRSVANQRAARGLQ
jgi:hypothetical protein